MSAPQDNCGNSVGGSRSREELLAVIEAAQAELHSLNKWTAGDEVILSGRCVGYADDNSGDVMVRLEGSAQQVRVREDRLRPMPEKRESVHPVKVERMLADEDAVATAERMSWGLNAGLEAVTGTGAVAGLQAVAKTGATAAGAVSADVLDDIRRRLDPLCNKPHADHRDMPCARCEAESILEILDCMVALPAPEKWGAVKAAGSWVDVSEISRRRVVAIEPESALQLAGALIAAAGAVEG